LGISQRYRIAAISGLSLAVYGLLSGLIGPRAPFFPADIINSETFTQLLIVPPPVFRTVAALVFMITITRALTITEIETDRIETELRQAEAVTLERNRTARDLHDGAIQRLYAAGLLVQSLRHHDKDNSIINQGLSRLSHTINELVVELRSILSGPGNAEKLGDPGRTLLSIIEEIHQDTGMEIRFNADSVHVLPVERLNHLSAILRESLSNIVRHASAQSASVTLNDGDGHLKLIVEDDGKGLPGEITSGYGIRDINDRARLLNGQVSITSVPEKGTMVTLVFPLK
jgi:signal transduction histidine kinase